MQHSDQPILLIVEDSPEDFYAVKRGLDYAGFDSAMVRCETGEEARDYLWRRGRFADNPEAVQPNLILLDLNLPGLSGSELLALIKQNEALRNIPVVIVSTSGDPRDIERSYALGANSYLRKSLHEDRLMQDLKCLKNYWLQTISLPGHSASTS